MVKEPRGCIRLDDREGMVVPLLFYHFIMVERFAYSNDPGSLVVDGRMPLVELPLANSSSYPSARTLVLIDTNGSEFPSSFPLFPASPGPCVASQQSIKKLASALAATAKSRTSFCSFIWHTCCMFYFWSAQEPPWVLYCVVSQLFQANCWILSFRPVHDC